MTRRDSRIYRNAYNFAWGIGTPKVSTIEEICNEYELKDELKELNAAINKIKHGLIKKIGNKK